MLAFLGIVAAEKFAQLFGGKPDVPAAYVFESTTYPAFWAAVLIAVSVNESGEHVLKFGSSEKFTEEAEKQKWTTTSGRVPGDFGFDPLGIKPKNEKDLR